MPSSRTTRVLKFGGTSLGLPHAFRRAVDIIGETNRRHRTVVVASALSGVTNCIARALDQRGVRRTDGLGLIEWMRLRHEQHARHLLPYRSYEAFLRHLDQSLATMATLYGATCTGGAAPHKRDRLLAFGERLSVALLTRALRARSVPTCPLDATCLIRTNACYGNALVDWPTTERQIQQALKQIPDDSIVVVPGFIGCSESGHITTLGRGGSDYTAALLAAALRAEVLERWTDTDGLYADDPRRHPEAKPLPYLTLEEATNLNHARKLGMHPKVFGPLLSVPIPLHVRTTMRQGRGTWILPSDHHVFHCAQVG